MYVCMYVCMYSVCTSPQYCSAMQCITAATAVYIKATLPIRHQKQATTASHTKCHKLGAGCCLDFSPDKEGGIFFATSKAPEKAKRGRIYGYTVHTYRYIQNTEYIRRTYY